VTLSLYGRAVSKARCEANGPALGKQRNAGGGAAVLPAEHCITYQTAH
jgi:hypothetical protein